HAARGRRAAVVGARIAVVAARRRSGAHAAVTGIGAGAQVAVVALGAVGTRRVGADAGRRVARPLGVALIRRRAHHGVGADAQAGRAAVDLGAGVAVVAGRAVPTGGVAADPGGGIAGTGVVTLVGRRTDHR